MVLMSKEDMDKFEAEHAVRKILQMIGDDPTRNGLMDTPKRVVESFAELYGGYHQDPALILKTFEEPENTEQLILLKDIEFSSTCLVGSTFVETPSGRIPISKIQDGDFVYCWDEDECRMTISRAINPRITGRDKILWRVYTDKDTVLCTGDHKFLTHTRGWIKARNLTPGDSIVSLNRGTIVYAGDIPRSHIVWTGMRHAVPEHRFIYEEINGEVKGKLIHHINKKPNDNRPENLTAMTTAEHSKLHRLEDGPTGFALFTDKQRRAMRDRQIEGIRKSQTEEVRQKRSEFIKQYWDSLTPKQRAERNHRVLLIEKTKWREDVWCMDVPGFENFVANGMVVHNCEHHMLPFLGTAHIAYIPSRNQVVGISKLARLLEVYTRRLQIQERIGRQVTAALDANLKTLGSACILEARHLCMTCRGVGKQHSVMVTSSLTGEFLENTDARQELLTLIRS